MTYGAADERRHRAGSGAWWGESWAFDAALEDGSGGLFARLTGYPRRGVCWFWAGVCGPGRPYVLCRELELAPPANPALPEVRGPGLWAHVVCETPVEHWTVAMEAFAVALDDPSEAWRTERGDRVGLAFDLEWESAGPLEPEAAAVTGAADGYAVACEVHGDLQVGDERWTVAATGRRSHEWGVLTWPVAPAAPVPAQTLAEAPLLFDRPTGASGRLLGRLARTGGPPGWSASVEG